MPRCIKFTISNNKIENYTKNNKRILRLKSGDPSVFGRGSEEIGELKRLKIPFKVFSGITAVQEAMKNLNLNYQFH